MFGYSVQLHGESNGGYSKPPPVTVHVHAVSPERDSLEITFPNVRGYRVELPATRLEVEFNEESNTCCLPSWWAHDHQKPGDYW